MTLKAVELQIAIPRATEAGAVQKQLLQKPVHDQTSMAAMNAKQLEEESKKTNMLEQSSEHLRANNEEQNNGTNDQNQGNFKKNKKQTESVEHPYKGHHIDLSL